MEVISNFFRRKNTNYFGVFVITFSIFSLNAFLHAPITFAYTETISTSGTVAIDVALSSNNANLGVDQAQVVSTCPTGYTVLIAGPTNNTLYKNGDTLSTDTISASSGTPTNPTTILNNNLGTWGYSLSNGTTVQSNFIGLTGTETPIVTKNSASSAGGDSIPVYYGVSITPSLTPGSYTLAESSQGANDDVIVYYLLPDASCAGTVIRYDDNGANSSTTMSLIHEVEENDEVTLAASNYQKAGYGFAGWSTVQLNPDSATFQTDLATAVSAGKVFGPNETITADSTFLSQATQINSRYTVTLYAIWVKPAQNATLQNWNGCSSLNSGNIIALTDNRDNNVYAVAKLADGNCWMIENLRLEAANSSDSTKAQGFGGAFTGLANSESANFNNTTTTANSKYSTTNITGNNQSARFPRYNNTNITSTVSDMTIVDDNVYGYGNYYTWASAMANTTDLSTTSDSESANTSLCPTGWKLPYGNSTGKGATSGGFYYLNYKLNNDSNVTNALASNKIRSFPNNFILSGGIDGSQLSRGGHGLYWSSSTLASNGNNNAAFRFNTTSINPGTQTSEKGLGGSIRCYISSSYTVSFNANGGTGTMTDQTINSGVATALTPNSFTAPTNKEFDGWNTASDGSGTSYSDEEVVTDIASPGGTITLYAQWKMKLYDAVAAMTKGTQTANNLQTTITSSNSGVYEYNTSAFGASTDASNDYTIYYYRGILDNTTGTYGSNGDGAAYPNYVKLDNTCWRIVRTTGSGGVKMIYNGTWTGSTCANATTAAQISSPVATSTFNGTANSQTDARQVVRVGYTHNSTYANTTTTVNTAFATVFGNNSNIAVNNTNSTIKGNVETWFNNNLSGYSTLLESNAGYCNDRYSYTTNNGTTATTSIRPYTTSTNTGNTYVAWFASQHRNATTSQTPSLGCSSGRNVVDVYSTDTSAGGNGQLSVPVGLLTADEASFAGSGSNTATNGSAYNANSYLRTGSNFWTMSPYARTGQYTYTFYLNTNGYLQDGRVDTAYGIRPVISLVHGTTISSGNGTATNPWTINLELDSYTVHFDANGGSGTMGDQTIYTGTTTALASNAFTPPTGKLFAGWNTAANGTGTAYTNEQAVTDLAAADGTITLYAQWVNASELYNLVAAMSKGTQTASDLQATITSSNSGVYAYNTSVFGAASDASNSHTIYYYRGILDNTTGSNGSDGDAGAYPNYVKLGNTCWRIFRTTGSGGVKMIYNGTWTGTTCANATTNAQVTTVAFGSQAGSAQNTWYNNIHRAGYTYNASVDDSTTSTSVDTVLGSSSNYSTTNTTASNIKTYLEGTWFTSANGVSAYESILEPDAGYCNDRTVYSNENGTTAMTSVVPYASTVAYFGPYTRHKVTNGILTLGCSRGTVDLYSTSSATGGNKQLSKPVSLITVDEAALSGNGYGATNASNYNANSFLTTGSNYWTLSPRYRRSDGSLRGYSVGTTGAITGTTPNETAGLRPVISLEAGTVISGGTGVATDPWTVNAP